MAEEIVMPEPVVQAIPAVEPELPALAEETPEPVVDVAPPAPAEAVTATPTDEVETLEF